MSYFKNQEHEIYFLSKIKKKSLHFLCFAMDSTRFFVKTFFFIFLQFWNYAQQILFSKNRKKLFFWIFFYARVGAW